MGWLEGKRALVAGAGSGIGRAVLGAFRAEGAQVAALELDQAKADRLAAEVPGCVVSRGDTREADLLSAGRTDLLRETGDGLKLARREIIVDESVLRTQNLAVFL